MAWRISFTPRAERDLGRIDPQNARRINRYLRDRVAPDPRALGEPLKGQLREFWRYRVGDHRILAKIEDEQLLVLVVKIGHRSEVYGGH
ncbi:MAG TPA: type II toxin-antitoxin system RelE/ParE family toxin [Syntrophobacteraceae bacterium]|nr:type II toxin-antitoxin system RelE/ParE family toxin [Syntrophobacteraceae bacterium]